MSIPSSSWSAEARTLLLTLHLLTVRKRSILRQPARTAELISFRAQARYRPANARLRVRIDGTIALNAPQARLMAGEFRLNAQLRQDKRSGNLHDGIAAQ